MHETTSPEEKAKSLSIVVPFYNEEGNVIPMLEEIDEALSGYRGKWELIAVDDGSRDRTGEELATSREQLGDHVRYVRFARNFGQTAAMQTGIELARGELIVTLDGDRQNDPHDIPMMIDHLEQQRLDMVCGWRRDRKDDYRRKFVSRVANWLIRKATDVRITDYGCSLKLYRSDVIKNVELVGEMHRFIPAWVASVTDPRRIDELPVNHRPRLKGESKYGFSRTARVILDLLAVLFFMRFSRRPGHFFGGIGLVCGSVGGLILAYLLALKIFAGASIGGRPLLFTGILLALAGIQFVTTGVLAEMLARTRQKQHYPVREQVDLSEVKWHAGKGVEQ
ncbi:MAG: glycosyltransferase family 2 protein [Lysobacterales bacterium]|jgi:glycosyltransferase involved in cell wall biosynthesis